MPAPQAEETAGGHHSSHAPQTENMYIPYLFDQTPRLLFAILCGFYSRAATNQERRLLNSVLSVKIFVNVRALRKASFIRLTKNYNAVT